MERCISSSIYINLHLILSSLIRMLIGVDALTLAAQPLVTIYFSVTICFLGHLIKGNLPYLIKSSVEAEYCKVANVVSESYWIRNLLLELHIRVN